MTDKYYNYLKIRSELLYYFNIDANDKEYKFYIHHFLDYIDHKLFQIKDESKRQDIKNEIYLKVLNLWKLKLDDLAEIPFEDFKGLYDVFLELDYLDMNKSDKLYEINRCLYDYREIKDYEISKDDYQVYLWDFIWYIKDKIFNKEESENELDKEFNNVVIDIINNWCCPRSGIITLNEDEVDNLYRIYNKYSREE